MRGGRIARAAGGFLRPIWAIVRFGSRTTEWPNVAQFPDAPV